MGDGAGCRPTDRCVTGVACCVHVRGMLLKTGHSDRARHAVSMYVGTRDDKGNRPLRPNEACDEWMPCVCFLDYGRE